MAHFTVIGSMKAGTSSFYKYLSSHPHISMTKTKEVNFFLDQNWKKGNEWYDNLFLNDNLLHGDVSPAYSRRHLYCNVAERMFTYNPRMKIIYIVRNPFERI